MQLRPVTVEDVAWLPRLAERLFAPWEDGYGQAVATWMSNDTTEGWIAVGPDGPIGFVLIGTLGLLGEGRSHVLEVLALGVHPDRRRAGVGRALLAQVLRHARSREGAMAVRLTVASDNAAGLGLFRQAGFTVDREDDGTFGKGRRAIRLTWRPR